MQRNQIHSWVVSMCNEGSWNILFSLKKQLCKTTSLFENTVVDHLHGLVGNKEYRFHKIFKDFMTYLFIADGSTDVRYCTAWCLCLKCQWGLAVICGALRIGPCERRNRCWWYHFSELLSLLNKCELAWEKCLCLLMRIL